MTYFTFPPPPFFGVGAGGGGGGSLGLFSSFGSTPSLSYGHAAPGEGLARGIISRGEVRDTQIFFLFEEIIS